MRGSRVRSARWLVASILAVALAACWSGGTDQDQPAATTGAGPATTEAASAGPQTIQVTVTGRSRRPSAGSRSPSARRSAWR
jgi:hypothetical protein